jgi:DNA-binding response OmpR family regulator
MKLYLFALPRKSLMTEKTHHVLIVEPDPAIRALMLAVLRRRGHTADAAETAEEALELQRRFHPAAVVVEPRIPGGRALLEALASVDGGTHPAVIVVTSPDGRASTFPHTPAIRTTLHKPFAIQDLADAVMTCCDPE